MSKGLSPWRTANGRSSQDRAFWIAGILSAECGIAWRPLCGSGYEGGIPGTMCTDTSGRVRSGCAQPLRPHACSPSVRHVERRMGGCQIQGQRSFPTFFAVLFCCHARRVLVFVPLLAAIVVLFSMRRDIRIVDHDNKAEAAVPRGSGHPH